VRSAQLLNAALGVESEGHCPVFSIESVLHS